MLDYVSSFILFNLSQLFFIRILGIIVVFDLYRKSSHKKYLLINFGLTLTFFSTILSIISVVSEYSVELILTLEYTLVFLGSFYLILGVITYFEHISKNLLITVSIAIVTLLLLIIIIDPYELTIIITNIMFFITVITLLVVLGKNINKIQSYMMKSYGFIAILIIKSIIFLVFHIVMWIKGWQYGLYSVTDEVLLFVYYTIWIVGSIVIIIFLVQFEHRLSLEQRDELKDKYSHDIGNLLQEILFSCELILLNPEENENKKKLINTISKTKLAGELIKKIRITK